MSREEFKRFVGFDRYDLRQGSYVDALATMAGIDGGVLGAVTPRREPGSRRVVVGRAWTDLSDMTGQRVRVCTVCLDEDRRAAGDASVRTDLAAWCRPEWSVRSVATCTRHHVLLTSRCLECGKGLDGANPAIDVCACGGTLPTGAAAKFHSATDKLLADMIAGSDEAGMFAGAGLHQLSAHLTRLGGLASGWAEERPVTAGLGLLTMRDTGLALATDGATCAALDAIVAAAPAGRCGKPGITSAYGWVWRSWLGVPTVNPLDAGLRADLLKHAAENGIRPQRGPRDITLAQAGAMLGSGHTRTRRLVQSAGLIRAGELPGVAMSLDEAGIERIASTLAGLLGGRSAAAALGVGRPAFHALAEAGLAKPDPAAAAIGAGELWSAAELRNLVDRVAGSALRLEETPVGCVPLPLASRNASVPLARLVRAMLEGHLTAVVRTAGDGLDSVWISVTEARRFASPPGISVRAAARRLGLHYEAARWLAAEGMLGATAGEVDASFVEAFAAAFVTAAQAARALGVPSRVAAARLRASGHTPTFGPPACRQSIWRREALDARSTVV